MEAVEKNIEFDEQGNFLIHLGKKFSNRKAKVLVLFEEEEVTEKEWLQLAIKGEAFDFWNGPDEDIYTLNDGVPYEIKTK